MLSHLLKAKALPTALKTLQGEGLPHSTFLRRSDSRPVPPYGLSDTAKAIKLIEFLLVSRALRKACLTPWHSRLAWI